MKKVLFIVPSLNVGGMEKMLVTVANTLAQKAFKVTIILLYPENMYLKELDKNIEIRYATEPKFFLRNKIPYIRRKYYDIELYKFLATPKELHRHYVGNEPFDIEVAFFRGLPVKIVSGSKSRVKKIAWIHSDYKYAKGIFAYFNSEKELREAYLKFDKIVCVSKQCKDSFCERMGIYENNVTVLYNMIDTKMINELSAHDMSDCVEKNKPIILTVARLVKTKGIDRLISACKKLSEIGLDYELWIVGDGPEKDNLKKQAMKNKIVDKVIFFGLQKNPYKFMKHADIYACASRFEGFNLTIVEALSCGLPIVSTNCTGPKEILDENKFGLVVNNSTQGIFEGLRVLLTDKSSREFYKENACKRAMDFDSITLGNELVSLFDIRK